MSEPRLGWLSSELVIEDALRAGYAQLDALLPDDAAADAFLQRVFWNAGAERRASFRTWLRQTDFRHLVIENYPREPVAEVRQIIVLLTGESHEFVGNTGPEIVTDALGHAAVSAEAWREAIGIITEADTPERVLVLHQLAKFVLSARRQALADEFELGFSMAQKDLSFAREFEPHFRYRRLLQVNVEFLQLNAADIDTVDIVDVVPGQEAAYAGL